ncbi:MAG: ATP-binding protein [Sideroxyarcus sp.]
MRQKVKMQLATDGLEQSHLQGGEPAFAANGVSDAHADRVENQQPSGTADAASQSGEQENLYEENYASLLPMLQRLDQRLVAAVNVADQVFAARAAGDLYRGLAISPADVAAAFGRTPGEPFLSLSTQAYEIAEVADSLSLRRLLWLQDVYELTDLDLDVILIGLAPEIDLRYERLYAYLQDDVTKRRPGIDLALNLLCASAGEKLQQRERFAPDAPLVRHQLIEVFADPNHQNSPLLARFFRLDEQIVRFLLLDDSMDSRLVHFCRMGTPAENQNDLLLSDEMRQRLQAMAANQPQSSIRLSFEGPIDCGQKEAVALLASTLGMRVLIVDVSQLGVTTQQVDDLLKVAAREAWLRSALLHVKGIDSLADPSTAKPLDALWLALQTTPTPFVIESESAWVSASGKPLGVATLHLATPAIAQREYCWRQCLEQNNTEANDDLVSLLAQRYRLNFAQIQDAAKSGATAQGSIAAVAGNALVGNQLTSSAKSQTRHLLANLALHIQTKRNWQDLVVPEDADTQLREICAQFVHRQKVLDDWGFGQKLSYGKGINVLFAGPSGTGKTMAAEIVANELGLDLYKINLAGVVSKYIGETEKNLDKIFAAAEHANAILFFDEADALFGKRTDVSDAHDRYANIEVSYLLQKMEQYEGITILATNLRDNMDEAFSRRLAFIVHFPFPNEAQRHRIWAGAWPATTPLADDIKLDVLAKQFKLSGGNIKNIALASAFLGATDGVQISEQHVILAASREYQKMGRTLPSENLNKVVEVR